MRTRLLPVAAAAALALTSASALAGSGVGGVFNLGQLNTVDGPSTLSGTTAGAQLKVQNAAITSGALSVYGLISAAAPGAGSTAVRGDNNGTGTAGYGVYGSQDGEGTGVYGTAATGAGMGVLGRHLGGTGAGAGVRGQTASPAGAGVLGVNTGGGPGLQSIVNSGVAPLKVNSQTKVTNLNADKLDGVDSSGFLPNAVPLSLTGSTSSNGVVTGTNTGSANGVQGETAAAGASGVYGQNDSAGFGVAGRANAPGGVGVYAEALGGGPGVQIHTAGAPPLAVDSSARVDNLNTDRVDGASILSNRIISTTQNDHILQLPGFGDFNVVSCNHTNAVFQWSSGGPNAFVFWWDLLNSTDSFEGVANLVTSNARPHHFVTVQLARDTGANTSMATVTITTQAASCVFAAQAVVQPG